MRFLSTLAGCALFTFAAVVTVAVKAQDFDPMPPVFQQWRGRMIIDVDGRHIGMETKQRFGSLDDCEEFFHQPEVRDSVNLLLDDAQSEDIHARIETHCVQGDGV